MALTRSNTSCWYITRAQLHRLLELGYLLRGLRAQRQETRVFWQSVTMEFTEESPLVREPSHTDAEWVALNKQYMRVSVI